MRLTILTFLLLCLLYFSFVPPVHADNITLSSNPDCVSFSQDRIDCVARATDSALWHTSWTAGSWNGWESFGGILTSGPSITSSAPGRLDMFARGADNAMWHIIWDGSLHSWESLGGILSSDPDCTSPGFGLIDCFVRGPDNALWHIAFTGATWSAWESIGGILTSGPGAASAVESGGATALVFVRGADNAMWEITGLSGAWSPWTKRGGILTSDPDAVITPDPQDPTTGRMGIVVRGPDNGIWWKWKWGGTWSMGCQGCDGYEKLGGIANSGPTIASRGWNKLEVFALGTDNNLYYWEWDGATWSPWVAVPMSLAPATVSTSSTIVSTSSESSSSSAPSTTSMEASTLTVTSQPTDLGTSDLTGLLQQHAILVIGVIALVIVLVVFASRARRRPIGA